MTKGVVYFLAGTAHALVLAVSAWSLRKHYAGAASLLACPEKDGLTLSEAVLGLSGDPRLGLERKVIPLMTAEGPNYRKKGSGPFPRAMITKAALHRHTPYSLTLHLDADTLPLVDPSLLFDLCYPHHVLLPTRPAMNPERVANMIEFCNLAGCDWNRASLPVNTGVMAYWKTAPLMEAALQLAIRGATANRIADELAMQALYPDYPHVLVGDIWNHSPIWGTQEHPKIWHSPGKRMTLGKMRKPWLEALEDAYKHNAGRMRTWGRQEAEAWMSQK